MQQYYKHGWVFITDYEKETFDKMDYYNIGKF